MNGYGLQLQQARAIKLTSSLRQAIEALGLSSLQFAALLEFKAYTNPFLELRLQVPDRGAAPTGRQPGAAGGTLRGGEGPLSERVAQPPPGLLGHVRAQASLILRGEAELRIAEHLIEGLEPSGWLGRTVEDIAGEAGFPHTEVEAVLRKLQQSEPAGLFARTLSECLSLQAIDAGLMDPVMGRTLANLELVAQGRLADVARLCGTTTEEVAGRLRLIRGFDPKPGARFGEPEAAMICPDLRVSRGAGGWVVDVRNPMVDAVVVRPAEGKSNADTLSTAERELLQEARSIRRAAERRDTTMVKVAAEIVRRQEAFLLQGPRALRPMRLVDIAHALGIHESTVSRITSDRHIETPRGVLPLRDFFCKSLGEDPEGIYISAAAIRERIRSIIAAEDSSAPVSDAEIAEILRASGCRLARRTVAKYREQLGLASSVARRRTPVPGKASGRT